MREQLSLIDRMQRIFAFQFDHDTTRDDKICTESTIKFDRVVKQRNRLLSVDVHST
jgi:hypothetical protein